MEEKEYQQIIEQWKLDNTELIESGKCRKTFVENLPIWKDGKNKGSIKWKESIGYKVYFIYEDIEYFIDMIDYIKIKNHKNKLKISYNNKISEITIDALSKCNLGFILGKITSDFKYIIGQIIKNNKHDLIIIDREYRQNEKGQNIKYYKYHCYKCNHEDWIVEYNLTKNQGCNACCKYGSKPILGINTIWDTDKWMIPIINDDEFCKTHTHGSTKRIYPTCPICGNKKSNTVTINNIYCNHGISCVKCTDKCSYPSKLCHNILEQLGVDFETEYSPSWIKPRRYDFYFIYNNNEYIIEMDGGLGHGKRMHNKNKQTAEESKAIDNYKDEQAKLHGIEVIRVDCDLSDLEYIKNNILNNKILVVLFNLSKINWQEAEEFALSNLVKVACEYKRNNLGLTTTDIGKIMKLNSNTICTYLKKGTKLGWCNYNPKEEKEKCGKLSGKNKGKQIEIFKNGISLGIFKSSHDLEEQSILLFGTKLWQPNISAVCSGTKPQYKGFTFKYTLDLSEEEIKQQSLIQTI